MLRKGSTTGINDPAYDLPHTYKLYQNYPNPFNPVTKIEYQLPKNGKVFLAVYDILGREIKILTNEEKAAGHHEELFDGMNFSSGIYFYRIEITGENSAQSFTETRRMILLK